MDNKSVGMQLSMFEGGEIPVEQLPKEVDEIEESCGVEEDLFEELPGQMSLFD